MPFLDDYSYYLPDLRELGKKVRCPFHEDTEPSLLVNKNGTWKCFGCDKGGGLKAFITTHVEFFGEGKIKPEHLKYLKVKKEIVAVYYYRDKNGNAIYRKIRTAPKDFYIESYTDGKWVKKLSHTPVLYNLPEVIAAPLVYVVEGEKDANNLTALGFATTTSPFGGGKGRQKWKGSFNEYLKDKDVVIIMDNDDAGLEYGKVIYGNLRHIVKSIRVISLKDFVEPKGDISDFILKLKGEGTSNDEIKLKIGAIEGISFPEEEIVENISKSADIIILEKFFPRPFTERMLQEHQFLWEGTKGNLWRYDASEGIWRPDGEDFVRLYFRKLSSCIDDTIRKRYYIEEILADLQQYTYKPRGLPEPAVTLIPLRNGIYDLEADTLRHFRPEDYFTWKLPHDCNPNAKCEYLRKLMDSFLPESETVTLWELAAYILWKNYAYQKFFYLIGSGDNGKTLYTQHIITKMLGVENIANVSLNDIQNNRFAASNLYRKLVNISGEVSYESLRNTRLLKQLTGEDYIDADIKFKKPVKFRNHAKLIFMTNQLPRTSDSTYAFYRRFFPIEFCKKFRNDPSIPFKVDYLLPEEEWEGLLFGVLQQLKDLMRRNFIFTKHQDVEAAKAKYEDFSNPILRFIDECCTKKPDGFIYKYEFLARLNEWLATEGFNKYSEERVGRTLKAKGFQDAQKGDKRIRAWIGIDWRQFSNATNATEESTYEESIYVDYVDTEVE